MQDKPAQIAEAKAQWEAFCRALAETGGAALEQLHADTDLDLAEGVRYLTRLTRLALQSGMENNDSSHPYLDRSLGPTLKMGGDNPQGLYLNAPINGADTFVLSGNVGSAVWLSFLSQRSYDAVGEGLTVFGDALFTPDLKCDDEGNFEIVISPDPIGTNTIRTDRFSKTLMIRQFFDTTLPVRPMDLRLQNLTGGADAPAPLTLEQANDGLQHSAGVFSMMVPIMQQEMIDHGGRPNQFEPDVGNPTSTAGGVPGGNAVTARWRLEPHQALVVSVTPPEPCAYWDVQVGNVWYESFDYRHVISGFTCRDAHVNPDGSVTLVVSEHDPDTANWLQAAGHIEGHIAIRWQLTDGKLPVPTCRVVEVAEVAGLSGLPRVDPDARSEQRIRMLEHVEQRFRS